MTKTTDQIKAIISEGGIAKMDAKKRAYSQILEFAKVASLGKGGLILSGCEQRTTTQLIELASYNTHNNIVFEIN